MENSKKIVSTLTIKLTTEEAAAVHKIAIEKGETAASRAMIKACLEFDSLRNLNSEQKEHIAILEKQLTRYEQFKHALQDILE